MQTARELTFSEIKVGLQASFTVLLTEQSVNRFLALSGDHNPLHEDEGFAQKTKFKKRVVPGMLLANFFSRLIGMYVPGKNSLYLSQTLQFKQPTFINDEIVISGRVTHISTATGVITLQTTINNAHTQVLLVDGEAKAVYLDHQI